MSHRLSILLLVVLFISFSAGKVEAQSQPLPPFRDYLLEQLQERYDRYQEMDWDQRCNRLRFEDETCGELVSDMMIGMIFGWATGGLPMPPGTGFDVNFFKPIYDHTPGILQTGLSRSYANNYGTIEIYDNTYTGDLKDGQPHGEGEIIYPDGSSVTGEFQDGYLHGYGIYTCTTGAKFVGEFRNGTKHRGTMTFPSGDKFQGEFQDGHFHRGTYTHSDGKEEKIQP